MTFHNVFQSSVARIVKMKAIHEKFDKRAQIGQNIDIV